MRAATQTNTQATSVVTNASYFVILAEELEEEAREFFVNAKLATNLTEVRRLRKEGHDLLRQAQAHRKTSRFGQRESCWM